MGALMRDPEPAAMGYMRSIMLNMDPPRHRQYRQLVNQAFRPRLVEKLRPRVREMVRGIIDDVIERGECDFVEDVAAILPMEVICEMMGVPAEDRRRIYELGNQMVGFDDPELQPDGKVRSNTTADAASAEMFMYADKLRQKAAEQPGDDIASALLEAELGGERLTPTDFQFFFLLLCVAGNETTRTVTTNGMIALLENPGEWRALQDDSSLVDSAVEEILRYAPAVHNFRRQTTRDTEIRGVPIPENSKVVLWYPSANRDEEVFADPQRFDVRRHPNDHLAFGIGEHFCLGASLARMELQEIFREIAARLRRVEMVEPPRRLRSTFINGVKEMRIRFQPGPRLAERRTAA
jgi:cholest-4-en-3-one 26-monooxygenase